MARGSKSKRNPRNLRTVGSEKQLEVQPPDWVIDINRRLGEGHTYDAGRSWKIYRVPMNLREVHKSAFVPKIISIGPFHYHDHRLLAMEEHKMRSLVRLLGGKFEESGGGKEKDEGAPTTINLLDLVTSMELQEQKARACYSESFDIPSDEFVQMMVIDGCFVVELLRQFHKFDKEQEKTHDPIFDTRWMLRTLQRDLLMLENQLPFFILEELFQLTSRDQGQEPSLPELTVTFFNPLLPREDITSKLQKEKYHHLLHLFRTTFLSAVRAKVKDGQSSHGLSMPIPQDSQLIHCAVELKEAGFKIKRRENCNLLDIKYTDGLLEIPPLHIDDNSVPLLFNFVAFEQCDQDAIARPFFTNFFIFLDSLIYSKQDIQILHKEGIINHVYGSDRDVAALINKLGREIVYDQDQCYLSAEMKELNDRCKVYNESKLWNWWRNLISNYFSNPWSFLSLVAAISLLILTFFQTFYTMYPFYLQE